MAMKQTKNTSIDLESLDEFDELIDQFMEESERAAVILGVAKIDFLLGQLLSKYLVASYSGDDPLLYGDSPISNFSSRINLTYRLGIIDTEFAKALHLIRKIRNQFAHEVKDSSLNASPHKERIREITLLFQHSKIFDEVRKAYFSEISHSSGNFFTALSILIMRLDTIIVKVEPVDAKKAYGIRLS